LAHETDVAAVEAVPQALRLLRADFRNRVQSNPAVHETLKEMRWVWDHTHRFRMRPDYSAEEINQQCETIVCNCSRKKYGDVVFPLRTDDLRELLETETESLDLCADLSNESGETELLAEFRHGHRPVVRITPGLVQEANLENRLRAALAHAYGHVRLHDFLFQTEEGSWLSFFDDYPGSSLRIHRCHRDAIAPLKDEDWMEWQAGYACGALLMPIGPLLALVRQFRHDRDLDHAALSERSLDGATLIHEVAERFQTSWRSSRVRLIQLGILAGDTRSLF